MCSSTWRVAYIAMSDKIWNCRKKSKGRMVASKDSSSRSPIGGTLRRIPYVPTKAEYAVRRSIRRLRWLAFAPCIHDAWRLRGMPTFVGSNVGNAGGTAEMLGLLLRGPRDVA